MLDNKLLEIYQNAIDNNCYFENKISIAKRIKMFMYYFTIIVVNMHHVKRYDNIHIINGKMELKYASNKKYNNIYYGYITGNISKLKSINTHMSFCTRKRRISIFLLAIKNYFILKISDGCLIYWVDFVFWNYFISMYRPQIVLSNGHFDRLTTILSGLCNYYKIKFYMQQHGIISQTQSVPYKIHCDCLYVFDQNEKRKFLNNVIKNTNCKVIEKYEHTVKFENSKKKSLTIGIIEQPVEEAMQIIRIVMNICGNYDIYIMLHPRSNIEIYRSLKKCSNIHFIEEKEWNLDLVISTPSTLAYDYIRAGFVNPIIFVDINRKLPEFKNEYPNLYYLDNIEKLGEIINDKISEIKKEQQSNNN